MTPAYKWSRFQSANSTDTASFANIGYAASLPTNKLSADGSAPQVHDNLMIQFFGKGSENTTFEAMLVAINPGNGTSDYIETPLGSWTVTLSAELGASGGLIGADERMADTLALATAFSDLEGVAFRTVSPANDCAASIVIDRVGGQYLTIRFKKGTADECNALVRELS